MSDDYYKSPEYARIAAAMCRQRAEANRQAYYDPDSEFGSLCMAEFYEACAAKWDNKANAGSVRRETLSCGNQRRSQSGCRHEERKRIAATVRTRTNP